MRGDDLDALIRSRVPIVVMESRDEPQALQALARACANQSGPRGSARTAVGGRLAAGLPLFRWSVTDGLERLDLEIGTPQRSLAQPLDFLKYLRASTVAGVYALLDFHPYLTDATVVRLLKDIAQDYPRCARTVVLISVELTVPRDIEPLTARCELPLPDRAERRQIVESVVREWLRQNPQRTIPIDRQAFDLLVENMNGLTEADTRQLALQAVSTGAIDASDVPRIMQAKYELLNRQGILRFEHDASGLADLGGLDHLKDWLQKRRFAFDGSAPALDAPKGVLLLGVQGCGKSLAARVSAAVFGVPLLRLDCGALFDKYVGESERNLRESLSSADLLQPCVLWVDEIEKGFAPQGSDGGASRRVLGAFLTWLAEKTARVFVVATANDIEQLPPELIRKGRFDEIFFVDLPDKATRSRILQIHAQRRGLTLEANALEALAAASAEFSGAELEQAVVAALYSAHAEHTNVTAALIGKELAATRPLAVVMAEQVESLRQWASERTVAAG